MMCAPSAFVMLKRLDQGADNAFLLDYDTRFGVYGNAFVHYDYRDPLVLSQLTPLKGQFKFIVLDPPYLEEKCFTRVAETVQYLAAPDCKVLACTGYMVRGLVRRLLHSNITTFEPRHRNGLANQFCTYTNYEDDDLKWAQ
ncbi:Protein-lysine N-methyltransferase efm5, partial [Dimargaris verticillata]